jgi:glycosyltransferase involved in cell wall biosynthesis
MTVTVLVPSFRRPDSLVACLDATLAGSRLPEQIVVALRDTDEESHQALDQWRTQAGDHAARIEPAEVTEPGQAAATNAALALARGDVVCFIDDDCRPTTQWLARIISHYDDASVVGVGGRDIVHHGETISARPVGPVGRVTWYGRVIGNHHQPVGDEPREVQHLKGANMSFRRNAVARFDRNLMGAHLSDTNVSLVAGATGRIVYDPLATVDHYPAPRPHGFARASVLPEQVFADAHDWAYVMLGYLSPTGRAGFWAYALFIGQDRRLGVLKALLALPRGPRAALRAWGATMRGLSAGNAHRRAAIAAASEVSPR